jgi:alkylated DNA repair dioxygenase AlkB
MRCRRTVTCLARRKRPCFRFNSPESFGERQGGATEGKMRARSLRKPSDQNLAHFATILAADRQRNIERPRQGCVTMNTLFSLADDLRGTPAISGLSYFPEYVTSNEEADLLWDSSWARRRQFYGKTYGEGTSVGTPVPDWAHFLIVRTQHDELTERPFDQMLVNEYLPGQGIALHRDYEPFDRTVASLSLLAACVMDFRHIDSGRRESLLLAPRSLLVLSDDARYRWEHGIARRKTDRWQGTVIPRRRRLSITLRLRRLNDTASRHESIET